MENTVELLGHYGGDHTHAQSAWSSTNRDLTPDKIARIPKLLEFLVKGSDGKSHETPFEKSMLHFLVTTDIASHIHIIKHRIGVSVNAESARYKELADDKAYIPSDWPEEWRTKLALHASASFHMYHACLDSLVNEHGFDKKRAKESARFFNPYCVQLTADVAFNFRSFVNFCKLRAVKGAQFEIRTIARQMIQQVMDIPDNPFEHSIKAWGLDQKLHD
jgi:flavin-dependent thymidylate synthase